MNVTIEIKDYSDPAKPNIRLHSNWHDGNKAALEVDGKNYTVLIDELKSALEKVRLNTFGY